MIYIFILCNKFVKYNYITVNFRIYIKDSFAHPAANFGLSTIFNSSFRQPSELTFFSKSLKRRLQTRQKQGQIHETPSRLAACQ